MGQVILITSGRGGAGKSTVGALLGYALCRAGQRVLLVEGSQRSFDILFGLEEVLFNLSDVGQGRCGWEDAVLPADREGRLGVICAPLTGDFLPKEAFCAELREALGPHFDFILIEVSGEDRQRLKAYASCADRAVIVCAPDQVSARMGRAVSDCLDLAGVEEIRLCVNRLPQEFVKYRPIPDLDWLIDQVCAQLIAVVPFDPSLLNFTKISQYINLANLSKMIFDNFAQRILGNYIDLLIE